MISKSYSVLFLLDAESGKFDDYTEVQFYCASGPCGSVTFIVERFSLNEVLNYFMQHPIVKPRDTILQP